ncbi:hypothetical protein [Paenibacillus larvae]|uniref:hypothetical protein n=1 Tax=Paenibacillus larvae TaxID=1464 RepID=UPI001314772A|nr:hypothetical protein [Paenibacillus larvae]
MKKKEMLFLFAFVLFILIIAAKCAGPDNYNKDVDKATKDQIKSYFEWEERQKNK